MRWRPSRVKHSKKLMNRESEATSLEMRERENDNMIALFNFRRLQKHEVELLQQKKDYEEEIAKLK